MKKLISVLLIMVFVFAVSSCAGGNQEETSVTTEKQTESTTVLSAVSTEDDIRKFAEEKLNLDRITVEKTASGTFGKVYAFTALEEEEYAYRIYLAVDNGENIFAEELGLGIGISTLETANVDGGDGDEIVVNFGVDAVGGAGVYCYNVYKFDSNGFESVFKNEGLEDSFTSELVAPFSLEIENTVTGKKVVLDFKDKTEYQGILFDENGNPTSEYMEYGALFDGFYEFKPEDVDGDGVSEIICKQYTSLYSHADGIGSATVTLGYDKDAKEFKIIDSSFEEFED